MIALCDATTAAARAPLTIDTATPDTFEQARSQLNQIPSYLEGAQCGGWNLAESVEGKIPVVQGVPGRRGVWNGEVFSGMAKRADANGNDNIDDDFEFPATAGGLSTACMPYNLIETRSVWRPEGLCPGEIIKKTVTYPAPYFEDPPCRWRVKKEVPVEEDEIPPPEPEYTYEESAPDIPLKPIEEYIPPIQFGEIPDEPQDRQSPPVCQNFCRYLNTWQYLDCIDPVDTCNDCGCYKICNAWANRYLCSDTPVPAGGGGDACNPSAAPTIPSNSMSCVGSACRCFSVAPTCVFAPFPNELTFPPRIFTSYFRSYQATYARSPVASDRSSDVASKQAQVACYGFYNEFDPKYKITSVSDPRCVINIDVSGMQESQKGKGAYGQNSNLPDRDPALDINQRNGGFYDVTKDLWYMKLGNGFSLLNEQVFEDEYDRDLSQVLLDTDRYDKARQAPLEQLDTARPLAKTNQIRAFDDTGSERLVTQWWQKQQNEIQNLMHRPVVRLLLPAGWALGADPSDPLFGGGVASPRPSAIDRRNEGVEVQINADEDTLGSALAYIERSLLLRVREEPIPVLLPMGSPTEFRARAEAWCAWYMRKAQSNSCDGAPEPIRQLVSRLEEYADAIEQVRVLRGELARYAGAILTLQNTATKPIRDWVKANMDVYKQNLEEQKTIKQIIETDWAFTQFVYKNVHEYWNAPWCMNQRFTTPVYSLLDPWLRTRLPLPTLTIPRPEDIIIDFSTIIFTTETVALPVLKPIQIRVTDIPVPPGLAEEHGITVIPPPLPSMSAIQTKVRDSVENLPDPPAAEDTPTPPPIEVPPPLGPAALGAIQATIFEIRQVIDEMGRAYAKFWISIANNRLHSDDCSEMNTICGMKTRLECKYWDVQPCTNVEMDLLERLTRIGSRPLVLLKEDIESKGLPRSFGDSCLPSDDVCTPMHPEREPLKHQWEILPPPETTTGLAPSLRKDIRMLTLPSPVGGVSTSSVPPYETDPQELLPIFDLPESILLPPPSSAASSRSGR